MDEAGSEALGAQGLTTVHLLHIPSSAGIPWQLHALESWRDPFSGRAETYLAGFSDEQTARRYAKMMGYLIVNETVKAA